MAIKVSRFVTDYENGTFKIDFLFDENEEAGKLAEFVNTFTQKENAKDVE